MGKSAQSLPLMTLLELISTAMTEISAQKCGKTQSNSETAIATAAIAAVSARRIVLPNDAVFQPF